MEYIEKIISLLRNVVFPIKEKYESLIQHNNISDYQVYVSLHEKNGIHVGGLPINENYLDISNIDVDNQNVKQFKHYLLNLEYIKINIYGTIRRRDLCCPCVFYCELNGYNIDVLNKSFSYDDYPDVQEVNYIMSKFKKKWSEK